jgi:hypothetical protein
VFQSQGGAMLTIEAKRKVKVFNNVSFFVLIFILVLLHANVWGQEIGVGAIDEIKVMPWITKSILEYRNVYHFGMSEMESDFRLIITDNACYAQIKSQHYGTAEGSFIFDYTNLKKVMIKGNKFFSNKTNGEFVICEENGEKYFGLKVYKPWSVLLNKGNYEIGKKSGEIEWSYPGKYPQASLRHLKEDELKTMSKTELEIMRNEIFARYGYIFSAGGKMEQYFKQQDWYEGQHKNVSNFLTDLEKENIKLINRIEKGYKEN